MDRSYIVSAAPASSGLFRYELGPKSESRLKESLDEWRYLCQLDPEQRYLFMLHRFPVEHQEEVDQLDLETVLERLLAWPGLSRLGGLPFGIQVSANLRMDWSFSELIEALIERANLPREAFSPRDPEEILSLYLHQRGESGRVFVGLSTARENLSPWSSGQCRVPRDADAISRAEAKLIEGWEAFEMGGLQPGLALDLGAAPGGWSRVLANLGYEVHAVDPAVLDDRIASRVHFHQETAGRYLARSGPNFDLLVCDMKMDPAKVAQLLLDFQPRLNLGAKVFSTFKLGKGNGGLQVAKQALRALSTRYKVEAARQLFFNRSEISVLLANPS